MSPQSYQELGRVLKHARVERKLTPMQVARYIYIRPRYLEALENGAFEALPGAAYVKGYLQQYARFLGLPAEQMAADYERIGALPSKRFFVLPEAMRKEERPGQMLVGITLGLAIVVAVAAQGRFGNAPKPTVLLPSETVKPASIETIRAPKCLGRLPVTFPPCYYLPLEELSPIMKPYAQTNP